MAINSSSASNSCFVPLYPCSNSRVSRNITLSATVIKTILTLPVCTFVLYLGLKRWRQQHSFKTTSHSDIFTYHMAAVELIWLLRTIFYILSMSANLPEMAKVAICGTFFVFYGETLFHILTCVDRYLAVVHPVTYLGLRNVRAVRIRNISIGCVWLLCFGSVGLTFMYLPKYPIIPLSCILVFSTIVVSFCSISVLCVLIRPGPVGGGREKERIDQTKQRAFHTIAAITVVLWLWFVGLLVSTSLNSSGLLSDNVSCVVMSCTNWFNLPCSLASPLLYLLRAGKLSCFSFNND